MTPTFAVDHPSFPTPKSAYIALGSNLGDRLRLIRWAIAQLTRRGMFVSTEAPIVETLPVDCPPGAGAFLNTVVEIRTRLHPLDVLTRLKWIEHDAGRVRTERNAPRPIDLDIVLFGDLVLKSPELQIPHPRMHERRFVLEPLAAVAGDAVHPVLRKTVRQLLQELPA